MSDIKRRDCKLKRKAVALIPLTQNKTAVVDLVDADLAEMNWYAATGRVLDKDTWYADRHDRISRKHTLMHRVIMERVIGRSLTSSEGIDHINGDGLDNRRSNLRIADLKGNRANARKQPTIGGKPTHSQFKGVSRYIKNGQWVAGIKVNRKSIHLGCFNSEIEAAKAYDKAAREHFGEFAKTNFPREEA